MPCVCEMKIDCIIVLSAEASFSECQCFYNFFFYNVHAKILILNSLLMQYHPLVGEWDVSHMHSFFQQSVMLSYDNYFIAYIFLNT